MIHSLKDEFDVKLLCDVLEASRGGYYDWVNRAPSASAVRHNRNMWATRARMD